MKQAVGYFAIEAELHQIKADNAELRRQLAAGNNAIVVVGDAVAAEPPAPQQSTVQQLIDVERIILEAVDNGECNVVSKKGTYTKYTHFTPFPKLIKWIKEQHDRVISKEQLAEEIKRMTRCCCLSQIFPAMLQT